MHARTRQGGIVTYTQGAIRVYSTTVDHLPYQQAQTPTCRLETLANQSSDWAIRHFCNELSATETLFPRADWHLTCECCLVKVLSVRLRSRAHSVWPA